MQDLGVNYTELMEYGGELSLGQDVPQRAYVSYMCIIRLCFTVVYRR